MIRPLHPEGIELRYNWDAALAQNPYHDCGLYFGSQFVHRSLDCGQSWEIISPDLTTNDTLKQKESANTGGLTLDVTNAENFTTIVSIAPSPVNREVIWVGTDDGNLQLTKDGGKNWTNLSGRLSGCPAGSWIPHIEVSNKNAGEAYVVVNNYRRNDWTPYMYHTTNYGQTWTRLVDDKKVDGYVLCMVPDPIEPNLLFLGTDRGLYFSINAGHNWQKWTNDYPSVPTRDLKIHPREHDLIIATFGRAIWIMDDIRPLRELARTNGKLLDQPFKVVSATDGYFASYRSVDGVRFTADAEFRGPNKSSRPMISIWVKPKKKEAKVLDSKTKKIDKKEDKKDKKDKVKIQVVDNQGDTIRTYHTKLKDGINRIQWNGRRDGPFYPSYKDRKPDADAQGGARVLPGSYKFLFSYGESHDSILVNIHLDPRNNTTLAQYKEKNTAILAFMEEVEKVTTSFDRLKEAKKTIKLVNAQMVHVVDSTKKDIKEQGKIMQDSINTLMNLYMLPKDTKGIRRSSHKLTAKVRRGMAYLNASDAAPTNNGQHAIQDAQTSISKVLEKVNRFFDEEWVAYRKKVEAVPYSLFK